jgi:hypothetical protein
MKQRIIFKGLAVAVIVLFFGLAVQPSVAVQPETEIDIEPKDYLLQTIIEIANNPDVKNLMKQYRYDIFNVDIDRSIYRKLLLRNPKLSLDTLFCKPSLSIEYLNKCYNNGIEFTKVIDEDKALVIGEFSASLKKEFFYKINKIISKDKELSNRLLTLENMNIELNTDLSPGMLILCVIAYILCIPLAIIFLILFNTFILQIILFIPMMIIAGLLAGLGYFLWYVCGEWEP